MTKHAVLPWPLGQADPWDAASMEAAFAGYESWIAGMLEAQDESLRFCRDFVTRSMAAADQVAASTNPLDAIDVQMRYAGEAMRDCLDEGTRILDITCRAALRALAEPVKAERLHSHRHVGG